MMSTEMSAMIVILVLGLITALIMAWHLRFQILGLVILIASAYLLVTSDMFLVIRVPTICVVGIAILLALFILIPRSPSKDRQQTPNH